MKIARIAGVFAVIFGVSAIAFADPPAPPAGGGDDVDVVEVGGAVRSLPRVQIVPADAGSVTDANEVGKLVALTALFTAGVRKPGDAAAGLVIRVTTSSGHIEAITTKTDGVAHRREVSPSASSRALDLARLVDGAIQDLTGTRSHLSGTLLFTDASKPGERVVRVMLASGTPIRDASPAGVLARGADIGPGGVVHFAAAAEGQLMKVFKEGQAQPIAVKVPGAVQSVAFSRDGLKSAVIVGNPEGGALWTGLLEGTMTFKDTGPGIAIGPAFGENGEMAWAAGPAQGPLRVFVDGKPVSPAGAWATMPSFCNAAGKRRVAFAIKSGSASTVEVVDLDGGGGHTVATGSFPACSPDGRTIAVSRGGKTPGVFMIGDDGIASVKLKDGEAAGLKWLPGPSLPPEG